MPVIHANKHKGETPLQMLDRLRAERPELSQTKMTYAGRLDPMAAGQMIILSGADVHRKDEFLGLDKVYSFKALLGISTDTGDILGLVSAVNPKPDISLAQVNKVLPKLIGKTMQKYPAYSSKPVQGKPLFWWARRNKLSEVSRPTKQIEIYDLQVTDFTTVSTAKLRKQILDDVALVSGDFRQEQITGRWYQQLEQYPRQQWPIVSMQVHCSTGTYVRSLAERMGELLAVPSLALDIFRQGIGKAGS